MNVFDKVDRILKITERVFFIVASGCLVTMLAANAVNIILRNFSGQGLGFVFPWTTVMFIWMNFLAFFVIYRMGKDISVKFIIERLGMKGKTAAWVLHQVTAFLVVSVLLLQAPGILALQVGNVSEFVEMERYWLSVPFFLSCFLIFIDVTNGVLRMIVTRDIEVVLKTTTNH